MKRDNKEPIETDFDMFEDNYEEEPCAVFDAICSMIFMPKPLGWIWPEDKIEYFLKERGYKIIEKKSKDDEVIKIAVKPDASCIPDLEHGNLREIFDSECQDILLSWMLKIGK